MNPLLLSTALLLGGCLLEPERKPAQAVPLTHQDSTVVAIDTLPDVRPPGHP